MPFIDGTERPSIPPGALSAARGWRATVAWAFVPERVTWRLQSPDGAVRYLKISRLDTEIRLSSERDRLEWAAAHIAVPRVLDYGTDDDYEWLLTPGLEGVAAVDDRLRADPKRLVPLLGAALRRFHALPVDTCPFDGRLEVTLPIAKQRIATGKARVEDVLPPEYHRPTVEAALDLLVRMRPPDEDLVVCHGDFCLPNVLISGGKVSGYVDVGDLAVADRWRDLAVATWSVTHNLGPGWETCFLAAYGAGSNPAKLAFYRVLSNIMP